MKSHFGFRISEFGSAPRGEQARRRNALRTTRSPVFVSPPGLPPWKSRGAFTSEIRNPKSEIPNALRPSFTLIELLVVMSIIVVLVFITVRVVGAAMIQARTAATESTIRKIHGLLDSRAQAFYRLVRRKGYVESTQEYSRAKQLTTDVNLQKILAMKDLERRFFPQVAADAALWPNKTQVPILNDASVTSGQLLYFILANDTLGADPGAIDGFSAAEVSTKTNGYPCFIDAWGNPIRFYRWPTRLFRPYPLNATDPSLSYPQLPNPPSDPTNLKRGMNPVSMLTAARALFSSLPLFNNGLDLATSLARDPDDPLQRVLRDAQKSNSNLSNFEYLAAAGGIPYHTPTTYHAMLVVSAGADGVLGLYEPENIPDPNAQNPSASWTRGYLANPIVDSSGNPVDKNGNRSDAIYDNITYLNVRAGGR